jgi:hypothetical protein
LRRERGRRRRRAAPPKPPCPCTGVWRTRRDRRAARAWPRRVFSSLAARRGHRAGRGRRGAAFSKPRHRTAPGRRDRCGRRRSARAARPCTRTGVWRAPRDRVGPDCAFGAYGAEREKPVRGARFETAASRAAPPSLAAKPERRAGSGPTPLSGPRQRARLPHGTGPASRGRGRRRRARAASAKPPCTCTGAWRTDRDRLAARAWPRRRARRVRARGGEREKPAREARFETPLHGQRCLRWQGSLRVA